MTATMSFMLPDLFQCDLTTPLSKSGVLFPFPWIQACLWFTCTKRMQQKWLSVTSETRSEEAMQLPPGSFGRLAVKDIQRPETIMLERHSGHIQALSWTQPSHFPHKLDMWVRKPSWKWTLQLQPSVQSHLAMWVFPVEVQMSESKD